MKYLRLLFILNCFLNYLWSQDLPLDFENNQIKSQQLLNWIDLFCNEFKEIGNKLRN